MRGRKAQLEVFLQAKVGLETDEITIESAHLIRKKKKGKKDGPQYYGQCEKVLNKYKEPK